MSLKLHPSYITDIQSLGKDGTTLSDLWIRSDVPMFSDSECLLVIDNPCSMEVINIADIRFKDRPTITIIDKDGNELYVDQAMAIDETFGAINPTDGKYLPLTGGALSGPVSFLGAYNNQLTVGKDTAGGRINFARGSGGQLTGAIGFMNATDGASFGIFSTGGGGGFQISTNGYYTIWSNAGAVSFPSTLTTTSAISEAGVLLTDKYALKSHIHTSSDITNFTSAVDAQVATQKGIANGLATIGSDSKIPLSQLPAAMIGQVSYQGTWNASTNSPTIPSATSSKGFYYVTSVAGTYNSIDFNIGDWIISDGTNWTKVDNTDAISSWNGRTGAITPLKEDYSAWFLDKATADTYYLTPASALDPAKITQSASYRFTTDTEKATWNAKQSAITTGTTAQYLRGDLSLATFPTLGTLAAKSSVTWTSDITGVPTGLSQIVQPSAHGNIKLGATTTGSWHGIEFSDAKTTKLLINSTGGSESFGFHSTSEGWIWQITRAGALSIGSVDWSKLTGVPSTFTPSAHNHDSAYLSKYADAIHAVGTFRNTSPTLAIGDGQYGFSALGGTLNIYAVSEVKIWNRSGSADAVLKGTVWHSGNLVGDQGTTHTHSQYLTTSTASTTYQPLENQRLSTSNGVTFASVTANGAIVAQGTTRGQVVAQYYAANGAGFIGNWPADSWYGLIGSGATTEGTITFAQVGGDGARIRDASILARDITATRNIYLSSGVMRGVQRPEPDYGTTVFAPSTGSRSAISNGTNSVAINRWTYAGWYGYIGGSQAFYGVTQDHENGIGGQLSIVAGGGHIGFFAGIPTLLSSGPGSGCYQAPKVGYWDTTGLNVTGNISATGTVSAAGGTLTGDLIINRTGDASAIQVNGAGWAGVQVKTTSTSVGAYTNYITPGGTGSYWGVQKRDTADYGTTVGCFAIEDNAAGGASTRFPIWIAQGASGQINTNRTLRLNPYSATASSIMINSPATNWGGIITSGSGSQLTMAFSQVDSSGTLVRDADIKAATGTFSGLTVSGQIAATDTVNGILFGGSGRIWRDTGLRFNDPSILDFRIAGTQIFGVNSTSVYSSYKITAPEFKTSWSINGAYNFYGQPGGNTASWSTTTGIGVNTTDMWVCGSNAVNIEAGGVTDLIVATSSGVSFGKTALVTAGLRFPTKSLSSGNGTLIAGINILGTGYAYTLPIPVNGLICYFLCTGSFSIKNPGGVLFYNATGSYLGANVLLTTSAGRYMAWCVDTSWFIINCQ